MLLSRLSGLLPGPTQWPSADEPEAERLLGGAYSSCRQRSCEAAVTEETSMSGYLGVAMPC